MFEKLKELLSTILPNTDLSTVTENSRLVEDLHFDSLGMMMLITEIEEHFGFRFNHFVKFETISDVCGYLESRV